MAPELLLSTLAVLLGLAPYSTWSAYYVSHSGRGWLACILCNLELCLPAVLVLYGSVEYVRDSLLYLGFSWDGMSLRLGLLLALPVLAYLGVTRRWHPLLRLASYAVVIGTLACMILADRS